MRTGVDKATLDTREQREAETRKAAGSSGAEPQTSSGGMNQVEGEQAESSFGWEVKEQFQSSRKAE